MTTRTTETTSRDTDSELAFLTRALSAPTLRESIPRLAKRARTESWTHEWFLAACLQCEVAARESHGGEGRIRSARFPARKSPEEFDIAHARGLKRDVIAHLGTLDFIAGKQNVAFLGPPGTGKNRHHRDRDPGRPGIGSSSPPPPNGSTGSPGTTLPAGCKTSCAAWPATHSWSSTRSATSLEHETANLFFQRSHRAMSEPA